MSQSVGKIGEILQKLHNLDNTLIDLKHGSEKPSFISDIKHSELEEEEEKEKEIDNEEFDHLDVIQQDRQINLLFRDWALVLAKSNPSVEALLQLDDKVSKHKGILNAFQERKANIKQYHYRLQMKQSKEDKYFNAKEHHLKFELKSEVDSMDKEIQELTKNIQLANLNIPMEI